MSSSSSSSNSPQWEHDVFVSFKPNDWSKDFTEGLFNRLNQVGISYFRDYCKDDVSGEKKTKRLKAISQRSFAIALIVLSKNYIDFDQCLKELAEILKSKKDDGLVVIPIFYEDKAKVSKSMTDSKNVSRSLRKEVQKISGYEFSHLRDAYALNEGEKSKKLIDIIVERLVKEIHSLYPRKVFGPFGRKSVQTWEPAPSDIKGITVHYSNFIESIAFKGTSSQPMTSYGGNGNKNIFEVKLEEGEYISSFAGYYDKKVKRIKSLTFRTNKRTLGPIGVEEEKEDEYFSVPTKAGKVTKIFYMINKGFLCSIKAEVKLHSKGFDPVQYEELLGKEIGYWDDGNQCDNVRKIIVEFEPSKKPLIRSVEFQCKEKDGEPEENGSNIVQNVKSYTIKLDGPGRYLTSISKSIGPFGGENAWDDGKFNGVKEIYLPDKHDIHYIRFVYDNDCEKVHTVTHPKEVSGHSKEEKVILDYPREYLTSISGYKQKDGSISSLTFYSNKTYYSCPMKEGGQYFCSPTSGSRIIGFYGTWGKTLHSIGVHVEPIPHMRPFEIIRPPLDGSGGTSWDDGVHSDVIGYRVTDISDSEGSLKIESITFMYKTNGSTVEGSRHGGGSSGKWEMLKFPKERLRWIKGYMREESDQTIIHNLEIFTTDRARTVLPYAERGVPEPSGPKSVGSVCFTLPNKENKGRRIVGFFGTAGKHHLNSIGARLEPY